MKKIYLLLAALIVALQSHAQITDTGNNVGIGTTTPGKKLEVNGDILLRNGTGLKQIYTWSPGDENWRIGMNQDPGFTRSMATSHVQFITYAPGTTQGFAVGVSGGNSSMEIRGSDHAAFFRGNVGIGTTTPRKKLEINGDILLNNSTGLKQIYTWHPTDENWRIGMNQNPGFTRSMATSHVQFLTYHSGSGEGFAVGVNGGNSSMEIRGSDHAAFFRGNVGIGTTTPGKKLEVNGDILLRNGTGLKQIYTWSPGDENWRIGMNQNPGFTRSMATSHVQFITYAPGTTQGFAVGVSGGNSSMEIRGSDHAAFFRGNVGIGTTTPSKKLEVNGDILLRNSTGLKQIYTWSPGDENWRIGMNQNPGFTRSMATSHVQFITYAPGTTQGFAVGANGGNSSMEIRGSDHAAFFRGDVGIGTTTTGSHKLAVDGSIGAREIKVEVASWPDFVFKTNYKLPTLEEVERYISKNKHLPEIPNEAEAKGSGISLGEMNAKLLQKIEELTLYLIEQNKQNQAQQEQINAQFAVIEQLKKEMTALKNN